MFSKPIRVAKFDDNYISEEVLEECMRMCIDIHMRTNIELEDDLIRKAAELTGIIIFAPRQ